MNLIFLLSVLLKGIGALLEILLQIMITREIGISGYGSYTSWITAADLIFWICFSGLVKCNTFYLSGREVTIDRFKRKYAFGYVLPVLTAVAVLAVFGTKDLFACVIPIITVLELTVLDHSSMLLARGKSQTSVIGEYVLGRCILVVGVGILKLLGRLNQYTLLALYVVQYAVVFVFFILSEKKQTQNFEDISGEVSLKKWGAFQRSDLMHSMTEQMPVVLQYLFAGAFEAGVVSIVLLVKKLINFISGPTAKVFLPEFSRLYHAGDRKKICQAYASIMRIQMLVVGPLAVVLLGFPGVVLGILAPELNGYTGLFRLCSAIFLLAAALGPCGGILQMTENERMDNWCRGTALILMLLIMFMMRKDAYFVLYGLCTQIAVEATIKYLCICRWMKKAPMAIREYAAWWLLPAIAIITAYVAGWSNSFGFMVLLTGLVLILTLLKELYIQKNEKSGKGEKDCKNESI